jgi:hypothetical protein
MKRVTDQDDPRRCEATDAAGGQCWNESVEESKYCRAHGGGSFDRKDAENYLTERFQRRIQIDTQGDDEVKLLRENLIQLNAMIAARMRLVNDDATMLVQAGPIADLIMKAEKVTVSLNRLAISSGLLLAKPALITWGQQIIHALSEMVEGKYDGWEDDLVDFSNTVASIIIQANNVEETKE